MAKTQLFLLFSWFFNIQFYNSYGLTECSIDSTISNLKKNEDGLFPSGFVVGDQMISIQDKSGALKPMGIWGEIYIEGECVGTNIESNYKFKKIFNNFHIYHVIKLYPRFS